MKAFFCAFGLMVNFWVVFPVYAATVAVKSGDHSEFTRLTLSIGKTTTWTLEQIGDDYTLFLDQKNTNFDLSAAFDRISRDRLKSLTPISGQSALSLKLNCKCSIRGEVHNGLLVLDISDASIVPSFPKVTPVQILPESLTTSPEVSLDLSLPNLPANELTSAGPEHSPPAKQPTRETQNSNLQSLRDTLLRQMSEAATSGSIAMQLPPTPTNEPNDNNALPQLRIGTDLGLIVDKKISQSGDIDAAGIPCIKDDALDLGSWTNEKQLFEQLPAITSHMLGEFDKPDMGSVIIAAKAYIAFGFGAEAKQLIKSMGGGTEDSKVLLAIADIVDSTSTDMDTFEGMSMCDGPAAFWSIFRTKKIDRPKSLNSEAALRSFSSLPATIRKQIGPEFIDYLSALPDLSAAISARESLLRALRKDDPIIRLIDAKLAISQNNLPEAEAAFDGIRLSETGMSAQSYVPYIEVLTIQDKAVDPKIAEDISALTVQYKGTEEQAKLREAEALAFAGSGNFKNALELANENPNLIEQIWQILANRGQDAAFLEHAVLPLNEIPMHLTQLTRRSIATRLESLGFGDVARDWNASIIDKSEPQGEGERLRATTQDIKGDPKVASGLEPDILGDVATSVAAEAMSVPRDTPERMGGVANSGTSNTSVNANLYRRDAVKADLSSGAGWQEIASSLNPQSTSKPNGELAKAAAVLKQSAATREKLDALLAPW